MPTLRLRPQEIALSDPQSTNFFAPSPEKPFVATHPAVDEFGVEVICRCLAHLQQKARQHQGLDYLQVFEEQSTDRRLWFIEDGDGGAITALLPSDY